MIQTIVSVVAAVAVLLSGILAYTNYQFAGKLAEARAQVQDHIVESRAADGRAARAEIAAREAEAEKVTMAAEAAEHAARAKSLEAKLAQPRPAVPYNSAADSVTALLVNTQEEKAAIAEIAVEWRQAYEKQLNATARLQAAVDTLRPAVADLKAANEKLRGSSAKLVDASRRSFWDRLVPDVGVGVAAGVNAQGKPDAVVGVTLSYSL